MTGGRQLFTCSACGKCFFFWVSDAVPQPKVKCYFCGAEEFPKGEPVLAPPAPTPSPAPLEAPAAPDAATPAS